VKALGGCSLEDSASLLEVEWDVATVVVLLLLKTGPSVVSSSSLEGTITTPLPLSRGTGGDEAPTMAKGMAVMGSGEVGVGMV